MSSSPVGPRSPRTTASGWGPRVRSRSRSPEDAQAQADAVAQANSEAGAEIQRSEQAVQEAQNESNVELQHIRDGFDQEQSNQLEKNQEALEKQRLKGYEELRDLKRRQASEYSRVRRQGERNLQQTGNYYRDTLYQSSRKNEEALRQQQANQAREMQYVANTGQSDMTQEKQDTSRKLDTLRHLHQQQITQLTEADNREFQRMKTNSALSRQQEAAKFQGQYDAVLTQDRQAIDNLQDKASREIRDIRQDTSQKLAAYSSRQSDPFYKLMDLGAELHDRGDAYVLTAEIPPQEQRHVSATVRGNTLVIAGTRRNEEHLTLGPGRTQGTSSYQSYEESFPLAWPVDRNRLTKEFQGDRVIITVPKVRQYEEHELYHPPEPARVRAERPVFPEGLEAPQEQSQAENGDGGRPLRPGRTLT